MDEIKDFLYLDMEKIISLYSQLSGGIIQSTEASTISSETNRNHRNYDLKILKHEAGGSGVESKEIREKRVSHHDLYNELEKTLFENGYAAEIGIDVSKDQIQSGEAVSIFEKTLCIKAEGYILLEDYERITRIADEYENVTTFINKSVQSNIREMPQVAESLAELDQLKNDVRGLKSGAEKNKKKNRIKDIENAVDEFLEANSVGRIDDWVIDGLKTWVRVFLPSVFNIRVYPFDDINNFHIMSNVKRECFLDDDNESVHYLFGSKPTIKMTMLGVVTSIPKKEESNFNPLEELEGVDPFEEGNEQQKFESGFRGVFRGFDGLEEMIRTCRFPRVMVQPLAIYRAIKPNPDLIR